MQELPYIGFAPGDHITIEMMNGKLYEDVVFIRWFDNDILEIADSDRQNSRHRLVVFANACEISKCLTERE
ncbi:MAG: hypothetical protein HF312_15595 [Ignavibacteria bacterium]|nr:hypothetical protein [Ignavibacteria bacterium]